MEAHDLSAENPRGDLIAWLCELLDSGEAQGDSGDLQLTIHRKSGRILSAEIETRERRHVRRSA